MNSDAKILLLYVQGLPDSATDHPLGELARKEENSPPNPPSELEPEPPPPPVRALIVCTGTGTGTGTGTDAEEHLFRPLGDETECAECRRATAYASWMVDTDTYDFPADMTWRQRVVAVAKADALRGKPA
ncbi:hypothetical protein [Streptomyces cyaneofuscatus]